jgi:hypothetical protein
MLLSLHREKFMVRQLAHYYLEECMELCIICYGISSYLIDDYLELAKSTNIKFLMHVAKVVIEILG